MTNAEIRQYMIENPDLKESQKVAFRAEITKRYSFSMACLAFAFIAVPLGLKSRRKDTSGGLIISLLIGAAYFLFTVLSDKFDTDAGAAFALWAPNIFCVLLGLWLFRRARFH
jgi:lipopolysaccharide export LptBFGC system permease protein LptF